MRSSRIALAWIAVALVALTADAITRGRTPFIRQDEVDYASVAYSLANGGPGVPTARSDVPMFPHQLFYGPVFFHAGATAFRLFGVSASSFRLVSLSGMFLAALAAAAVLGASGASRSWMAFAFAIVLWSPDAGNIATNGRMDALAIGFEIAGLAALAASFAAPETRKSFSLAVAAGTAFALAALTTPRVFPYLIALTAASPLLLVGRPLRAVAVRLVAAGATATALVTTWTLSVRMTPIDWLRFVAGSSGGDYINGPGERWSLPHYLIDEPQKVIVTIACLAIAGVAIGAPVDRRRGSWLWFLLAAAIVNLAASTLLGRPFDYGAYISLPLLVAVLLAASLARADRRRWAVLVLGLLGLACLAVRVVKYVEVVHSWAARDDVSAETYIREHVPSGSRLYSDEAFFFYAAERVGVHFRTYPQYQSGTWLPAAMERARTEGRLIALPEPAGARFVLTAKPDAAILRQLFACVTSPPLSAMPPTAVTTSSWFYRLPILSSARWVHGYSRVFLYRIDDGCRF